MVAFIHKFSLLTFLPQHNCSNALFASTNPLFQASLLAGYCFMTRKQQHYFWMTFPLRGVLTETPLVFPLLEFNSERSLSLDDNYEIRKMTLRIVVSW